ncbi:MAG: hypothetical protein L3K00_02180 [Thermoplasmata archaeon]|nr:hypothetical protein [Thermoplasmata archaeon]MCI4361590.1 hypothetical protein [Thermoplasmata archaeon]
MPPTCSNCGASDFVWANELKTGMTGGGTLSLRSRGEVPLGTRICRTCGHADLFLRDLAILHQPHTWRPGEFVPITPKAAPAKPAAPHVHPTPPPSPPPPPPAAPAPAPTPYALTPPPYAPLAAAPAVSGETEASRETDPAPPMPSDPATESPSSESSGDTESTAPAKPKTARKRGTKSKASSDA